MTQLSHLAQPVQLVLLGPTRSNDTVVSFGLTDLNYITVSFGPAGPNHTTVSFGLKLA